MWCRCANPRTFAPDEDDGGTAGDRAPQERDIPGLRDRHSLHRCAAFLAFVATPQCCRDLVDGCPARTRATGLTGPGQVKHADDRHGLSGQAALERMAAVVGKQAYGRQPRVHEVDRGQVGGDVGEDANAARREP